ncbi:LuxR C-terminal-related transcriptional regulator [Arthrobacter globiformis]|uniref:LuxR C-terminal-related transcriptional regulator n=1 Tax=Arthrobacter globiformis TaxID=1665 RepID=UPI00278F0B6D|nr:LuxR family transcriptional regulator [Arthrobacter globiformis]MDQ0617387.1 DNA-binding CsgD family transcriptional regulator/tetratricopeptide (TPR) repeat protein [Arthrobacter globiformis]
MASNAEMLLREGHSALDQGDWRAARSRFAEALEEEPGPDALYGLARASEWSGDYEAAISFYEGAFAGFRSRGESRLPALIAGRELSFLYTAVYGNSAAANGWMARAVRLSREAGDCVERGWVELAECLMAEDPNAGDNHARAAMKIARRFGDVDLLFCAMSYEGLVLVLKGRIAEGMRRIDEAAAAASGGEVHDYLAVGEIYCKMLACCELTLDVRRAEQWMAAAEFFGHRANSPWIPAICAMHYGGILTAAGRWPEAETQLCESMRKYDGGYRAMRGGAVARLADLRILQGRLGEAAELLQAASTDGYSVRPRARLHLVRGEAEIAVSILRRHLAAAGTSRLIGPELALLAEAQGAAGRAGEALAISSRLESLAADTGLVRDVAFAEVTAGRAGWAEGSPDALAHLEAALGAFTAAGLPWDEARTRLLIARAVKDSNVEVATAEARAALMAFRKLGAAPDADAAGALLRSLGSPGRPAPRIGGPLTAREAEVLRLLAEGDSNDQIAGRLVISKRTVEHHVGSILAKLGLSTRAQAQAYAVRRG